MTATKAHRPRLPALIAVAATAMFLAGCSSSAAPKASQTTSSNPTPEQVRVVTQNILHGADCPEATNRCDLDGRMALFTDWLAEAGCPPVVTLQEANRKTVEVWKPKLAEICRGDYRIVWHKSAALDTEVMATTLPVVGSRQVDLAGPFRTALWVRLRAPVGELDVVSTHLASGGDDQGPCTAATCPAPCKATDTIRACQTRQIIDLVDRHAGDRTVGMVVGDLNASPDSTVHTLLTKAGFVDTHTAFGLPECDPDTGDECTSGRGSSSVADLSDPKVGQSERIDYVLLRTTRDCRTVKPTGLFHPEPASPPGPDGLVFPSDHTGVQATIRCATTKADAAAVRAPASSTTSTSLAAAAAPPEVRKPVTEAYSLVFDGDNTDMDARIAGLQDADQLRALFLKRFAANGSVVAKVRVRVDDVNTAGPNEVDVVYSILLDGQSVLDHLSGRAVRIDGRWLVAKDSFCQVATLGMKQAPAVCHQEDQQAQSSSGSNR